MNRFRKHIILLFCCVCLSYANEVNAQTDPDPPPANPWENCVPDPFQECPIDGGVGLLIAAGVVLGARGKVVNKIQE